MDDLPAGAAGVLGARNEAARIVREIRGGTVSTVRISIRPQALSRVSGGGRLDRLASVGSAS